MSNPQDNTLDELDTILRNLLLASTLASLEWMKIEALEKAKAELSKHYLSKGEAMSEINIREYPEGFRFGANEDIIVSSEVLSAYVEKLVLEARIDELENLEYAHTQGAFYSKTRLEKRIAQLTKDKEEI